MVYWSLPLIPPEDIPRPSSVIPGTPYRDPPLTEPDYPDLTDPKSGLCGRFHNIVYGSPRSLSEYVCLLAHLYVYNTDVSQGVGILLLPIKHCSNLVWRPVFVRAYVDDGTSYGNAADFIRSTEVVLFINDASVYGKTHYETLERTRDWLISRLKERASIIHMVM